MAEPGTSAPPLTRAQAVRWKRQVRRAGVAAASARVQEPAAVGLVRAAGVGAGDTALDLGAGDGNAASAAARAGARVVACDLNEGAVRAGSARVAGAGWVVADAERLPFRDAAFTQVVSNFAVVYAPDPDAAVREAVRVLAPGGRFAFTAHTPDSLHARVDDLLARFDPPTLPYAFPLRWGDPDTVAARLDGYADDLAFSREQLVRRYPSFADLWRRQLGPGGLPAAMRERLEPEAHRRFTAEYRQLLREHGAATGTSFALPHAYLRVVARIRLPRAAGRAVHPSEPER